MYDVSYQCLIDRLIGIYQASNGSVDEIANNSVAIEARKKLLKRKELHFKELIDFKFGVFTFGN